MALELADKSMDRKPHNNSSPHPIQLSKSEWKNHREAV